jgi:hypothetical protein
MGRTIADRVDRLDRGSAPERASLLQALLGFEVQARAVDRAARLGYRPGTIRPGDLNRAVRAVRSAVDDSLASAGLEAYSSSARSRAGAAQDDPLVDEPPVALPAEPLRLPMIGETRTYRGTPSGPISIAWRPGNRPSYPAVLIPLPGFVAFATILAVFTLNARRRPVLLFGGLAGAALCVALYAGGPIASALLVVALVAVGRFLP